jgi:uncharacterized protein (DUF2384 family)
MPRDRPFRRNLMSGAQCQRDPDETRDIAELINEIIPNAHQWLDTPNSQLAGKKPKDLIWDQNGSLQETSEWVRELVRAYKNGVFW